MAQASQLSRVLQLRYALRLVWASGPRWCLASGAVIVLQGFLPLASLFLLRQIVDAIVAAGAADGDPAALLRVYVFIGWGAAVALMEAGCRAVAGLIAENQSQAVADYVQERIQAKSVGMDIALYETPEHQDVLHRAQVDARTRPLRIVNALFRVSMNLVSLLGVAILLLAFHWGVTLLLAAGMLPGLLFALRISRRLFDWKLQCTEMERKTYYLHWVLTGGLFAQESKVLGFGPVLMRRFRVLRERLRRERLGLLKWRVYGELAAETGGVAVVFGCFAYMALKTVQGSMTLGSLVMFTQAMRRAEAFVRDSLQGLAHLYEDSLFLQDIRDFMELEPAVCAPEKPLALPDRTRAGFCFEGVTFCYPGMEQSAVSDVSFEIPPGRRVALVGHNGSGKSTLIKLLCRFYDPSSGRVTYGGEDIRQFDPAEYRKRIGAMFQNFNRYFFTARENIWLGNVAMEERDERVLEAARMAGADRVIGQLDQGYETQLGRWFKKGAELSHGQWQKIALARAFVSDANLLVLDEPSSFLDAAAEEHLFSQLRGLASGRSVVFVSHRFSTVRLADWIYVLAGGRVVEQGNHISLLKQGGLYAEMFTLQAKGYAIE